jgi:hypothetical protein
LVGITAFSGVLAQSEYWLWSSDRLDSVCVTNRLRARLGKSEVLDLARLNQFLRSTGDVFDGHVRVNPVPTKQIDHLNLEPLQ